MLLNSKMEKLTLHGNINFNKLSTMQMIKIFLTIKKQTLIDIFKKQ